MNLPMIRYVPPTLSGKVGRSTSPHSPSSLPELIARVIAIPHAFGDFKEEIQDAICHPILEHQGENEFEADQNNGKEITRSPIPSFRDE
jgi:hypothetical protein